MTATYLERLAARTAAVGQRPVPRPRSRSGRAAAPASRRTSPASSGSSDLIIEAAGPYAAAIKPNLAFYEALGSAGMAALERIRGRIPAEIPVVIDAKRADIGSTAARHAVALFDRLGADAVTVNPYPGGEAIAPLFERPDRYAYVLCRTSNPDAAEFQNLVVAADPSHRRAGRAAPPARRPARRRAGGRAARSASSSARPHRRSSRAIRAVAPGLGVPRAGDRRTGRRDRAGPARRAGDGAAGRCRDRAAGCSSTCRAGSRRRPRPSPATAVRTTPASVSRQPPATGLRQLPVLP